MDQKEDDLEIIIFFVSQKKKSLTFETTWEWVKDETMFICGWTFPLRNYKQALKYFYKRADLKQIWI